MSRARRDLGRGGGGGPAPSVPPPGITSKSRQKGCSRAGEVGEARDGLANRRSALGKGMAWVPSGGQDDLGLETAFLSFFFSYLFYTEHFSNLCVILAGRPGTG